MENLLLDLFPTRFIIELARFSKTEREKGKKGDSPLMANPYKLFLVLRVGLNPETGGKYELADGGAEAREEGVERLFTGPSHKGLSLAPLLYLCFLSSSFFPLIEPQKTPFS